MRAIVWTYPRDLLEEGAGIEDIARQNDGVLPHARRGWLPETAGAFRS